MTGMRLGPGTALLFVVALGISGATAHAQTTDGPGVAVDRTDVASGDRIVVTIGRFDALQATISVCGNNALRGSADCNMPASEGVALSLDGSSTLAELPVAAPPVPCPCVIRVSIPNNEQVAYAPINLIGHPTAPLTAPEEVKDPFEVRVAAERTSTGFVDRLRTSAGGPAQYVVEATIRNRSSATFSNVRVSGSAGRNPGEELVVIRFSDPGELEPGQTWRGTASVEVPALTLGEIEWRITASGAGAPATGTARTSSTPWLLWALGVVLVLDLLLLVVRFVLRRVHGSTPERHDHPFIDGCDSDFPEGNIEAEIDAEHRPSQLVS